MLRLVRQRKTGKCKSLRRAFNIKEFWIFWSRTRQAMQPDIGRWIKYCNMVTMMQATMIKIGIHTQPPVAIPGNLPRWR